MKDSTLLAIAYLVSVLGLALIAYSSSNATTSSLIASENNNFINLNISVAENTGETIKAESCDFISMENPFNISLSEGKNYSVKAKVKKYNNNFKTILIKKY